MKLSRGGGTKTETVSAERTKCSAVLWSCSEKCREQVKHLKDCKSEEDTEHACGGGNKSRTYKCRCL